MTWTWTQKSLLLFSGILIPTLLWSLFDAIEISVDPNYRINVKKNYSHLEYTDADGSPEDTSSCSAIMQGDTVAVEKAKILAITKDFKKSVQIPDEYYINATQDCRKFISTRKYLEFPLSQEEEDFPLAYSIVTHQKVQNFERLLRAIYAPQNVYCVHVDKKADVSVLAAIMGITSCFPNVIMVSKPVSVVYASWSRVQADLNCMADLYNTNMTWKYFINLCGQDFPLKTNLEMVRSLQALNGGNNLMSEQAAPQFFWRWQLVHEVVDGIIRGTGRAKGPPPFNLPILFGSAYIIVNRGYVRSVLEDSRIQALIEWAKDTYSPDEILWATIQRVATVPGSTRPNHKFDMTDMNSITRLVKWNDQEGADDSLAAYPPCHGIHVRAICVYGAGDLQWIIKQHHLFANKFDIDTDPIAMRCMEMYLRHKALTRID
ncbi:beta-1,3-galactosyl-O-glycosyl-glycoprotein beta-1,6-N-acetylglucosaminyltransferase-like [Polymixia lowei]